MNLSYQLDYDDNEMQLRITKNKLRILKNSQKDLNNRTHRDIKNKNNQTSRTIEIVKPPIKSNHYSYSRSIRHFQEIVFKLGQQSLNTKVLSLFKGIITQQLVKTRPDHQQPRHKQIQTDRVSQVVQTDELILTTPRLQQNEQGNQATKKSQWIQRRKLSLALNNRQPRVNSPTQHSLNHFYNKHTINEVHIKSVKNTFSTPKQIKQIRPFTSKERQPEVSSLFQTAYNNEQRLCYRRNVKF